MRSKLISPPGATDKQRTYVVVLDPGDEVVACVSQFAEERGLSASQLSAIGAFSSVVLGYFEWDRKDYRRIRIDEQVEVIALLGDVALKDGRPHLHPHVTVAKSDGSAWGGHLLEAVVRPTLEIVITESPQELVRRYDPET
ncbi:MAG: PPC domain-containing DNA-binding protein, partial [Steroidobacteraceae bacterium]